VDSMAGGWCEQACRGCHRAAPRLTPRAVLARTRAKVACVFVDMRVQTNRACARSHAVAARASLGGPGVARNDSGQVRGPTNELARWPRAARIALLRALDRALALLRLGLASGRRLRRRGLVVLAGPGLLWSFFGCLPGLGQRNSVSQASLLDIELA